MMDTSMKPKIQQILGLSLVSRMTFCVHEIQAEDALNIGLELCVYKMSFGTPKHGGMKASIVVSIFSWSI